LEDNLRRAELGTLVVPEDIDVATFLLSDGQANARPTVPAVRSLGQLLDAYIESVPAESIEESSLRCLKVHTAHFKRVLSTGSTVAGPLNHSMNCSISASRRSKCLRPGMTGHARIYCGCQPIGKIGLDYVMRFVRTEFWW
jgi:hypothetical protein